MAIAHLARSSGGTEQIYGFSGDAVIGRASGADVVISDPTVSRRHASLRLEGKTVVVEDLGSANGTLLNGAPVRMATRAEHGDTIRVGAVELELRIEDGALDEPDVIATPTEIITAEDA